jgi:hypothetical protein
MQPPVVLGADQMQRAPVQPRDQHGAVIGQRAVDIGSGQPGRAGPDRQPRAARVLALHGQQPAYHCDDGGGRLPRQQLGGEPFRDHSPGSGAVAD